MTVVEPCGIKSEEDAALMNEVKPDCVDFVFAPGKHQIPVASVYRLSNIIRYSRFIGVFVDEQPATIARVARQAGLDVVQLYGGESDADIRQLKESCNREIRKALHIGQTEDMDAIAFPHVGRLLMDNYVQGLCGGSGERIATDLLQKLDVSRLITAGGVYRGDMKEILALQPYGTDISNALETNDKKDKEKVRTFMKQSKG